MMALSLRRKGCIRWDLLLITFLSTTLWLNSFYTCKGFLENCAVPCSEAKNYFRKALSPSQSHMHTVAVSLLTDPLCVLPEMEEPDLSGSLLVFTVHTARKASAMPKLNPSYSSLNYFLVSAWWSRPLFSPFERPFKSEDFLKSHFC